jgi:hypothetical protein
VAELGAAERQRMRTTLGVLAAGYAVTFLVAVLLHVGVEIPLGFAVLEEPRRPVAVLVEGVAGLLLGLGALAVLARRTWAWAAVTGAHAVALAGVGWGGGWWPWPPAVDPTPSSTTPTTESWWCCWPVPCSCCSPPWGEPRWDGSTSEHPRARSLPTLRGSISFLTRTSTLSKA